LPDDLWPTGEELDGDAVEVGALEDAAPLEVTLSAVTEACGFEALPLDVHAAADPSSATAVMSAIPRWCNCTRPLDEPPDDMRARDAHIKTDSPKNQDPPM
jgi:hypothetical protein